jgi:hypothetical protein
MADMSTRLVVAMKSSRLHLSGGSGARDDIASTTTTTAMSIKKFMSISIKKEGQKSETGTYITSG